MLKDIKFKTMKNGKSVWWDVVLVIDGEEHKLSLDKGDSVLNVTETLKGLAHGIETAAADDGQVDDE